MPAETPRTDAAPPILAFKGLDADFKCRGFQYEVGKTYSIRGRVEACTNGFHACENPFDVWEHYPIGSRFAEVELSGAMDQKSNKIAAASITIKAEITLPEFIKRAVARILDLTNPKEIPATLPAAEGVTTSDQLYAQIGSSGDAAQIGSSGYAAQIGSSGYAAKIDASGEKAVVASAGKYTRVKAKAGSWISLAEFNDDGDCIGFATGCVGKDGLEPDIWYEARGGKLVAAQP